MNKIIFAAALLSGLFPIISLANVDLTVRQDDFSNEKVTTLRVSSMERRVSTLFVSCFPSGINIQFAFSGTIFPDDTSNDGMIVSITHKFDTAQDSHTSNWHMNMMKYDDAWYRGDLDKFIEEALVAQQLNIRLNRNGDIVRFDFSGAAEHLQSVKSACNE